MKFCTWHKVTLCAGYLVASSAQAGIMNTFTDRASWDGAVGNFVTEAFDVTENQSLANNTEEDVGGFNVFYTNVGGVDQASNRIVDSTGSLNGGLRSDDYLSLQWGVVGNNATDVLELRFDTPVKAFAASFTSLDAGDGVSLVLDGTTVNLDDAFVGSAGNGFLGWILENPVSSIGFSAVGKDTFFLDDVSISEVPVPAAVWLFGSALLGLVGISRKGQGVNDPQEGV